MDGKAIVITNGKLPEAKTAHGLIRGTERYDIVGIIDYKYAGKDAGEVLDGIHRDLPVYASVAESIAAVGTPIDFCIVGLTTPGGTLPPDLLALIKNAIEAKMSIVNGLHDFLTDLPEFVELAEKNGVSFYDVRKPRPKKDLQFWSGKIKEVTTPKVAVLGTDCAVGKRTTSRFLMEAANKAGFYAEMIFTGQTGWLQGGKYGFIFDSTVNDFISGEIEHAIHTCFTEAKPDIMFVEGQSSLRNPSGPCGSEFLVSGEMDGVILQHRPSQEFFHDYEKWGKLPSVQSEIDLIKMYGVDTLAVTLNTRGLTDEKAQEAKAHYTKELGLPVFLPLQKEVEDLLDLVVSHFNLKQ